MRGLSSGPPQRIRSSRKWKDYAKVFTGQHTSTSKGSKNPSVRGSVSHSFLAHAAWRVNGSEKSCFLKVSEWSLRLLTSLNRVRARWVPCGVTHDPAACGTMSSHGGPYRHSER